MVHISTFTIVISEYRYICNRPMDPMGNACGLILLESFHPNRSKSVTRSPACSAPNWLSAQASLRNGSGKTTKTPSK